MTIKIRKLNPKSLIYIQIIYNFFIKFIIGTLGLPSFLNYITDAITAVLFVYLLIYMLRPTDNKKKIGLFGIIAVFFLYTLLNWVLNRYSPIYYLWGLRNTFRFYTFFMACTVFLDIDDIHKLFKCLFWLTILSFFMCIYQYFILGLKQDFISGFFAVGEVAGGNGPIQVLLVIVCTSCFVQYMEKKINVLRVSIVILLTIIIAVIGELKAMFLFLVLSAALASLLTKFSYRKLLVVVILAIGLLIGLRILAQMFPTFADFFNSDSINEYAGDAGYTGQGDINRFTAIEYCFKHFLKTPFTRIFGIGLGNADGSTSFRLVTSNFFARYSDRTHFNWFSVPFVLIENGLVGLAIYFLFFVAVFKDSLMMKRKCFEHREVLITTAILALFAVLMSFYNQVLRVETMGYTFYALLATPYVVKNNIEKYNLAAERKHNI